MPRPKKIAAEPPKQETLVAEKPKKDDGLIELNHFCQEGRMFIGNEVYTIKNGVVRVKPEHVTQAKEHIKLGG